MHGFLTIAEITIFVRFPAQILICSSAVNLFATFFQIPTFSRLIENFSFLMPLVWLIFLFSVVHTAF